MSLCASGRSGLTGTSISKNSSIQVYQVQQVERTSTTVRIVDLASKQGKTVAIEGEVAQIKQTSGPTIFTIVDESGTQNVAAFVEAGVRAYPEVELNMIVRVIGEVMMRNNRASDRSRWCCCPSW